MAIPVLFLAMGAPWPPHSGVALRTWGLLRQIGACCDVHLLVVARRPLSAEQRAHLAACTRSLAEAPLRDVGLAQRLAVLGRMARARLPYHSAVLRASLEASPEAAALVRGWPGVVFTNVGHWGTFAAEQGGHNWILNQCDADIQFWQAYAEQAGNLPARMAARANYRLARHHFPAIYRSVGRIVSVSEDDRALTLPHAGATPVDVILNGIDAAAYRPDRSLRAGGDGAQLLFTGTSARRNVTALRDFVENILPRVRATHPEARLLVAGNFAEAAQAPFRSAGVTFTGRVDDMAPSFNAADIFVAPFREAHGSKLKVAEAMAMALPVVATEAGVRGYPVVHGESALIARDDAEFARHIAWLIENPEARTRIGQAARTIALNLLDWDMLGKHAVALIEERWQTLAPGAQAAALRASAALAAAASAQQGAPRAPAHHTAQSAGDELP